MTMAIQLHSHRQVESRAFSGMTTGDFRGSAKYPYSSHSRVVQLGTVPTEDKYADCRTPSLITDEDS